MHLVNEIHINAYNTAQDVLAHAREVIAKRREWYSRPNPVFIISPKPEAKQEAPPKAPPKETSPLPPLLSLVVWPEWRLGLGGGRFSIREIQRAVARQYPIEFKKLIGHDRTYSIVKARHVAMALCKLIAKRDFSEIGRRFGGKDHTTVLHAVRKMQPVIKEIQPIADTASLSDLVTLAFDAFDRFIPPNKLPSGRPKRKIFTV